MKYTVGDRVLYKLPLDDTEYVGIIIYIFVLPRTTICRYTISGEYHDKSIEVVRAEHRIRRISFNLDELVDM